MDKKAVRRNASQRDRRFLVVVASAVVIAAAAAVGIFYAARGTSGSAEPKPMAAEFSLPGLGGDVALADYRGKYVLLNFWATWCPPCKAELPGLYAYHQLHKHEGFTLLGVNAGEDPATVRQFIEAEGYDFPVALDMTLATSTRYHVDAFPTSFLIGPDGRLVKTWPAGMVTPAMLERDVTPLLDS